MLEENSRMQSCSGVSESASPMKDEFADIFVSRVCLCCSALVLLS